MISINSNRKFMDFETGEVITILDLLNIWNGLNDKSRTLVTSVMR